MAASSHWKFLLAPYHAGVTDVKTQGMGSGGSLHALCHPMPKPSPFKLPWARCEGKLVSMIRSRASYDCLMIDLSGHSTTSAGIIHTLSCRGQATFSINVRLLDDGRDNTAVCYLVPSCKIQKQQPHLPSTCWKPCDCMWQVSIKSGISIFNKQQGLPATSTGGPT